jgi:amino acid transporter
MSYVIFILATFLFGYTLVVAIRYMLRYRVVRADDKQRAVLPLHIWMVATSYDILLLGAALQQLVHYRWWHSVVYIPALLIGIYAMWVLGRGQRPHEEEERHA